MNIQDQIRQTHEQAAKLRKAKDGQIKKVLLRLASALEKSEKEILAANRRDLSTLTDRSREDRLLLNAERLRSIASSIRKISRLPNPSGRVTEKKVLPNKLLLQKVTVPLGVVGAIYESRPNVTFDIAALCLRSMNGCVLKGSREAEFSNKAAVSLIHDALAANKLPAECVALLPSDRESVEELFHATKYVDVIIPRGSDQLIQFVRQNSKIPVIETGAGVCHIYVEKSADISKAKAIVLNAKLSRPTVCNAVDTIIVDKPVAGKFLTSIAKEFMDRQVEIYADNVAHSILKDYPFLKSATPEDFGREFLSLKCAVKVVDNLDQALEHINQFSTRHSEAIVSENKKQCERFLSEVDAAAVYMNASTRFTDGEEFGLGAEIGISTQKLHARGPFALEKLVTEKWIIKGNGQIRK